MTDAEVLAALRKLGDGSAGKGFMWLCATAYMCPVCLERWDAGSRCTCSGATP